MAQNLLSGITSYCNVGGPSLSTGKWKAAHHTKAVPVNNMNGGGFEQNVQGLTGSDVTMSAPYDAGNMPFTSGEVYNWHLGLMPGLEILVPARITNLEMDEDVDGAPVVNITAKSTGSFVPGFV